MKIRASVLTQVLAVLTVAALIGTGIALGQSNRGDTSATLLDSALEPGVAVATGMTALPEATPTTLPTLTPTEENVPVTVAGSRKTGSSPTTTLRVVPTDYADSEDRRGQERRGRRASARI